MRHGSKLVDGLPSGAEVVITTNGWPTRKIGWPVEAQVTMQRITGRSGPGRVKT